jgi:hypothetical protein
MGFPGASIPWICRIAHRGYRSPEALPKASVTRCGGGGLKSTLFSGEGLVVDLTGPGRVLMQTRSQDQFLSWLIPQLPIQRGSED